MTHPAARKKIAQEATVTAKRWLTDDLLRLTLNAPALVGRDVNLADHYIKLLFVPEEADYAWPFNYAHIRETQPRALHPVTRTYTFRSVDPTTGDFELDFVIHGDAGLAAPWAMQAKKGDVIGFLGPGGAWRPEAEYEHFVLAGDESASPAIARAIELLPAGASATAYLEVADDHSTFDMPTADNVDIVWVPRDGATAGTQLSHYVREAGIPEKKTSWFIHGVAEMIKELRRFLFVDGGVDRADVSISGYWRLGMTEDQWQATKKEFVESMDKEEQHLINTRG